MKSEKLRKDCGTRSIVVFSICLHQFTFEEVVSDAMARKPKMIMMLPRSRKIAPVTPTARRWRQCSHRNDGVVHRVVEAAITATPKNQANDLRLMDMTSVKAKLRAEFEIGRYWRRGGVELSGWVGFRGNTFFLPINEHSKTPFLSTCKNHRPRRTRRVHAAAPTARAL